MPSSSAAAWRTPSCTPRASRSASRSPRRTSPTRPCASSTGPVRPAAPSSCRSTRSAPTSSRPGAENHTYGIDAIPADRMILDVGSQSVERIKAAINDAATLVWNGPLGAFEIAPFDQGTVAAAPPRGGAHDGRASSSRSRAAATRSRRSTMPASPTASPTSRRPAARSWNGSRARRCPASRRCSA